MSESYTQFGYRMPNGTEVWAEDYSQDGTWTTYDSMGIDALPWNIDVYDDTTLKDFARQLKGQATVLSRIVTVTYDFTYGSTEEHLDLT